MTEKRYDVIDKEEPRGQSVTYKGIPCTARTCVTRLNRLTEENEQLKQRLESKEKAHTRCDGLYWKLYDEKEQLKKRLDEVLKELYCKDRRLEELGEDIECCDKQ